MGLVYLCVDHAEDGKPVALKTFRPELLSNRSLRNRFLREGTIWMELGKHPHIVHCYQVFKIDIGSEVFFALELVAAAEDKRDASLRSWLKPNKPIPLEQALIFAFHICRGMTHATNKIPGIIHRDLKPENILIGRDGCARITDFGLAKIVEKVENNKQLDSSKQSNLSPTQLTQGIVGTPLYMAPEHWRNEPLDERADIYAFGCILFEMLCGIFVVMGENFQKLRQAHCQGRRKDIQNNLPDQLRSLLQRCLALNRAERYSNWADLLKNFTEIQLNLFGEKVKLLKDEITDKKSNQQTVGWSFTEIGKSYLEIGKYEKARDYFNQVLDIARQENDSILKGVTLCNIGNVNRLLGDSISAIDYYKEYLAITRKIDDRHGEGVALGNIGNAFYQLGNLRQAIEFYKQDLTITREIGDRQGEAQVLGNIGNAYYELANPHRAIEFYKQNLDIAREIGDRHGEGIALGNLGSAYYQLGDLCQAMEYYEQDLAIAREMGDRYGEGAVLGNQGNVYADLGNHHRAIELYEQHLAISREIGDRFGEGTALGNIGNVYADLGEVQGAIEFYEQHLIIAREIGDIAGVAETCYNMALLLQYEQSSVALDYANEALHIFNQLENKLSALDAQNIIDYINEKLNSKS